MYRLLDHHHGQRRLERSRTNLRKVGGDGAVETIGRRTVLASHACQRASNRLCKLVKQLDGGPFSRQARTLLARAVAEQPGIGGSEWNAAKHKIAAGENGKELVAEIEFWLEGERWPRNEGAPIDALLARVDRLKESMRRRLSGDSAAVATFAPAHRQCAAVYDSLVELAQQGVAKVLPRQIEQLVAHATPGGATNPAAVSQVGCMR